MRRGIRRSSWSCCGIEAADAVPGSWSGIVTQAASTISPRRYLALWFPFLPTERWRMSFPSGDRHEPLLLVAKERNAIRVTSACPRARALGLLPGLSLADARARVPNVRVADADLEADARLLLRLVRQSARWSPMVAPDVPDGLLMDIEGCAHLFGGEAGLAEDALAHFGQHFTVRHALASTPSAAHALVRFPQSAPDETKAIRNLPIAALRLEPGAEAALRRAGLKRVADLADRPTAPLSARFGQAATASLDRLLGRIDSRITPLRPLPALHFARRFAEPIGHVDSIRAVLASLALEAIAELDRRGEGGRCFAAAFFRSDGAVRELSIETGQPTRDAALIGRLFHERIEALADPLDPGFGFDLIRFAVPATEVLAISQADLHNRPQQGEALGRLIDRLSVRHGRGRIRRIVSVDSHVPERTERSLPAQDMAATSCWPKPPAGEPALRPIFLFDPPHPVDVLAEVPDAPPRRFRWKGVAHTVVRAEGPERIAAPWWTKSGEGRPTRDYYRVEDDEGRRFWLFRQGLYERESVEPRWYLHGLFA